MTDDWFMLGMHGVPDWIGTDAIMVNLPPSSMTGGSGLQFQGLTNTIAATATGFSNGAYLHWVQLYMTDWTLASGHTDDVVLPMFFATSYDWTRPSAYADFMNSEGISSYLYSGVDFSLSYYQGEIAMEAAQYASHTGGTGSPAYPLAVKVWNYYYHMLNSETNGTYVPSLAREINATVILSGITGGGNSTYAVAVQRLANMLEKNQAIERSYPANSNSPNEIDYFHNISGLMVNNFNTYGQILDSSAQMGVGYVASDPSGTLSISLVRRNSLGPMYLVGTQNVTFWMNSNSANSSGTYRACLAYITTDGTWNDLSCPSAKAITLPGGAGSIPFTPYSFTMTFANQSIPAGAVLAVQLTVTNPGHIPYVLWDSTNGRSNIQLNYYVDGHTEVGTCTIPAPKSLSQTTLPQQQPSFLDTTTECAWGLQVAADFTGNSTDAARAALAYDAIHIGYLPTGYHILSVPSNTVLTNWRIFTYANGTYIDTDYSTYKAMLVVQASALVDTNQTLMDMAMSRVWDRMAVNSTHVGFNTGEATSPHLEFNSETQSWGITTLRIWQNYWVAHGVDGNFAPYEKLNSEQVYLQSFAETPLTSTTSKVTYLFVNPAAPLVVSLYNFMANNSLSSVMYDGVATTYTLNSAITIPSNGSVSSNENLGSSGNWTILETFPVTTTRTTTTTVTTTVTQPVTTTMITTWTTTSTTTATPGPLDLSTWAYATMAVLLIVGLAVGYLIKRPSASKP